MRTEFKIPLPAGDLTAESRLKDTAHEVQPAQPEVTIAPLEDKVVDPSAEAAAVQAETGKVTKAPVASTSIPEPHVTEAAPAKGKSSRHKQKATKPEPEKVAPAEPPIALQEGEELRKCEWEKCGKMFAVKVTGRTVVRRFCSGTCRGRASEARTGKR